jgi:hypothetical protein
MMKHMHYESAELYALRRQWSHASGGVGNVAVKELNPHLRWGERVVLGLSLWAMLGLVAFVVLASRYFVPAVLAAVCVLVVGMKAAGVI